MNFEPELPLMTITELEDEDKLSYDIVMEIVRVAALGLYHASPATNKLGLEKCMEAILDMINTGYAKVLWSEDPDGDIGNDILYIGYFNSATGKYTAPGCDENSDEINEEDWIDSYDEDA